jgi:hypothetical protein
VDFFGVGIVARLMAQTVSARLTAHPEVNLCCSSAVSTGKLDQFDGLSLMSTASTNHFFTGQKVDPANRL